MNEIDQQSSDGSSNENSSNRRSQRRRTNVQTAMRSSSLTTTIFNDKLHVSSPFVDPTKENDCNGKDRRSSNKFDDQFVLTTSNDNPKLSFWTVTDRQADWYKLTVPIHPANANSLAVSSRFLNEIFQRDQSNFNAQEKLHQINDTAELIMKSVTHELDYDLDDEDLRFLGELNKIEGKTREISEEDLENAMIILEYSTAEQIRMNLKQKCCEDEQIVCDVCLLADGDDGNEMVFCERCNVCVHQNCYGISDVPSGTWLCKPCSIVRRPACFLCPKFAGPMKPTPSGTVWCHLTCALWLPELKFSDYVRMEPILNLDRIAHARWTLRCVVCSTSDGACVQCAQKNCRTPFHVTCGLSAGYFLDVQQTSSDENRKSRSQFNGYCAKHSEEARQRAESFESNGNSTIPLTVYRREQLKNSDWTKELEGNFSQLISRFHLNDRCPNLFEKTISEKIFDFWKKKREENQNRPLIRRIDFVLDQRETNELLLGQINFILKVREKICQLEVRSRKVSSNVDFSNVFNQRLERLKSKLINRRFERFRTLIENSKNFIVALESNFRHDLQPNTTYLVEQTPHGQMLLVPKQTVEISDSTEILEENIENAEQENNQQIFPKHKLRYACYGNLVTCVTGSFN